MSAADMSAWIGLSSGSTMISPPDSLRKQPVPVKEKQIERIDANEEKIVAYRAEMAEKKAWKWLHIQMCILFSRLYD